MIRPTRLSVLIPVVLAFTLSAAAQTPPPAPTPAQGGTVDPDARRPANTTVFGDTGLWFVPTGEILPNGLWSVSGYRINRDRNEGFTDVSDFAGTFAFGARDRVEIFTRINFQTRVDVDRRPLLSTGVPMDYPAINDTWSTGFGDIYAGAKFNLMSQHRQQPMAVAVRGIVKLPTADENKGLGSGKAGFTFDGIFSKEFNERVEIGAHAGVVVRGDTDLWDLSNGFQWGVGLGAPTRKPLRFFGELHGERYFDNLVTYKGVAPAVVPSPILTSFEPKNPVDALVGLQYQHRNGFFVGAGLSIATNLDPRSDFSDATDETGDALGFQFRLGYHPGVRVYALLPPPPPPPPPPAPANRPPTVRAQCDPCTVVVCEKSTVTATGQDPDGDALTYRWTAPTGTFANPSDRQTIWTAPCEPGSVPVTVTVDDGHGGTASDTVTIQVVRPARREYTFEDVHFDFDRYTLRPEATRVLDEAIRAMRDDSTLRLQIEGHTCNIGTAEYNLALGDRRARAVRDYLASQGISADRLTTVSYGEERPKHDNSREETRRLNRRAALTVRLQ
jgi:outer membrane protein OmpA-like peptidoglycan-associated protein